MRGACHIHGHVNSRQVRGVLELKLREVRERPSHVLAPDKFCIICMERCSHSTTCSLCAPLSLPLASDFEALDATDSTVNHDQVTWGK